MTIASETWEDKAAAKRASILAAIPAKWRLSPADIKRASEQRQLTGAFVQQFLDPADVSIVSMDSVPIVEAIRAGKLSSVEVATAFCKAAAVAHQIVCKPRSSTQKLGGVETCRPCIFKYLLI